MSAPMFLFHELKTGWVLLISTRKFEERKLLTLGEREIISQLQLKYLEVILDSRPKFKEHLKYTASKAYKILNALPRITALKGCLRSNRRFLLAKLMRSVMLYATLIWIKALNIKGYARQINAVHRLSVIRVISAFRTISSDAAEVITTMPKYGGPTDWYRTLIRW